MFGLASMKFLRQVPHIKAAIRVHLSHWHNIIASLAARLYGLCQTLKTPKMPSIRTSIIKKEIA
jgi:hypothetical protein